jgi:uncharacterized protein (TIGR03118 family)
MMPQPLRSTRSALLVAATTGLVLAAPTVASASSGHYQAPLHKTDAQWYGQGGRQGPDLRLNQVNLASDIPGLASVTDPNLKNPWGNSLSPTSPLWISNQVTDNATVYSIPPGSGAVAKSPAIRVTMADSVFGPSGQVANTGTGFVLSNGTASAPAAFIFATLDGHIEAWSPKVDPLIGNAEDKVNDPGSEYTGLAIASTRRGDRLFSTDFSQGQVDVFDSAFKEVDTTPAQFSDPRLPQGYLPFNVQALDGKIFVAYDKADPATGRQAVGEGLGVVDEFNTDGRLLSRIVTGGALNAPWGMAIAPDGWGSAAGSLLVGNFGDGRINVIAKEGSHFAHQITGQVQVASTGKPFAEPGLWGIRPGTAVTGGTDALLFTAGINQEQDGLLGLLRP